MKAVRRSFGKSPGVSLFTLGTMRATGSKEEMYAVLKEACNSGINHIETAPAYGKAEEFLGITLKELKSQGVQPKNGWIITSKLLPEGSFEEAKDQITRILDKLQTSKIENLAIHGLNIHEHLEWVLNGQGSQFIKWAKRENIVNQIGFSSHGSNSLIQEAIESNRFTFCSLHLHLLDQERIPLAKRALKKGMGVMAISPADKGGHLHTPSKTLIDDCIYISPLELGYRFLLSQGISTLTLGAKEPKDLLIAKKLANAIGPLSKLEQVSIANLESRRKLRLGNTYCGQCQECLPCPNNIPIPNILRLRNLALGHDLRTFAKERYNLIGKAGHWWDSVDASACERCNDCLPRCPNNLDIPTLLNESHQELKDAPSRRLWG